MSNQNAEQSSWAQRIAHRRRTLSQACATMLIVGTLFALTCCGCKQAAPVPSLATYPAKGKVVTTGKLPVGGCVQFQPVQNSSSYVANGIVGEDGKFTLKVPYVDRVLPGATEGPHTVRVLLPLNQGGSPVPIAGTFIVKPGENDFTIEMPSAPAG